MIVNGVPSVNRAYRVNIRTKLERTVDVGCVGRLIEHSGDFGQRKPQYCNTNSTNTCIKYSLWYAMWTGSRLDRATGTWPTHGPVPELLRTTEVHTAITQQLPTELFPLARASRRAFLPFPHGSRFSVAHPAVRSHSPTVELQFQPGRIYNHLLLLVVLLHVLLLLARDLLDAGVHEDALHKGAGLVRKPPEQCAACGAGEAPADAAPDLIAAKCLAGGGAQRHVRRPEALEVLKPSDHSEGMRHVWLGSE